MENPSREKVEENIEESYCRFQEQCDEEKTTNKNDPTSVSASFGYTNNRF
jgi:hypothetical protein